MNEATESAQRSSIMSCHPMPCRLSRTFIFRHALLLIFYFLFFLVGGSPCFLGAAPRSNRAATYCTRMLVVGSLFQDPLQAHEIANNCLHCARRAAPFFFVLFFATLLQRFFTPSCMTWLGSVCVRYMRVFRGPR